MVVVESGRQRRQSERRQVRRSEAYCFEFLYRFFVFGECRCTRGVSLSSGPSPPRKKRNDKDSRAEGEGRRQSKAIGVSSKKTKAKLN